MAEIRIDPLTGDLIIVNNKRMDRPVVLRQSKEPIQCPFCIDSSKRHPGLPLVYEALAIENLFPSLQLGPVEASTYSIDKLKKDLFSSMPNIGKCEVLLYSSNHDLEFYDQTKELTLKIMKLWKERFVELQKKSFIKYIFIFENRGSEVGATIQHPHGQLYALPVIPPRIKKISKRLKKHYKKYNTCLICSILESETNEGKRIIYENEFFIAFVPYYSTLLYEVQIVPKKHCRSIEELQDVELEAFGSIIKTIRKKYDILFQSKKASFMMMLFNSPVNESKKSFFHFYLQFVCLDKDEQNFKYRASVETGLHVWTNDSSPEKIAEEFRKKV